MTGPLTAHELDEIEAGLRLWVAPAPEALRRILAMARASLAPSGRCWYWLADDPEISGADPDEVFDGADLWECGEVVKLGVSVEIAPVWAVRIATTYTDDGEVDESLIRTFATADEALIAARPTASEGNAP